MILTDLFESPEIHNRPKLDSVLARCIELIHEKNRANPKKYGRVAACISDMKNRKVFGINSPGADGRRRHAERVAIDTYHKRYGKILPGAIIVTTLSPCNRDMLERDGPSCQDLLLQAGIEKVYSGYMDPSQHSDHPFTEETTENDQLWEICKQLSDSFVHDDLTESEHQHLDADQVLDYVKRAHAPEEFDIEYSITDHPEWELKTIPLSQLNLDPDGEAQDPYNRVNWVDDDKVQELIPRIGSVLKSRPIVVDPAGWIIDGNHRAMAAVEAGLTSVPALVPIKQHMAEGSELPGDFKLMGQNLFLKNLARNLKQRYPDATVKLSSDRVTAYHNEGDDEALSVMGTEVMDSGYIGVGLDDAFTESFQGVLVPTIKQTTEQLLAANPGTKPALFLSTDNWNPDAWTHIATKLGYRLVADDESLDENFADGKGPGRPGDSVRHGIPKKATMAELEKASHAKGRKGQLARWQLNMRRGRKKTNEVTVGVLNLGEFAINVDDHAFERAQQRKINLADIDTVLRKIKLPRVIKKIMDIDVGNRFYVLDHVTDVALGFRRIGDKKLVLKTVYSGRPMDLNIAGIITV